MSAEWKDVTSYSQTHPRGTVDPRGWEIVSGDYRFLLHHYTGLDGWFLTCDRLGLRLRELGDIPTEEAKTEARRHCRNALADEAWAIKRARAALLPPVEEMHPSCAEWGHDYDKSGSCKVCQDRRDPL